MSVQEQSITKGYDLLDASNFRHGPPHAIFDELRQHNPVHAMSTPAGDRVWALTRHTDIRAVTNDSARFTVTKGPIYMAIMPQPEQYLPNIIWNDPPNHTRLRYFYSLGFGPRVVRNFEKWIRDLAVDIVAGMAGDDRFDFVEKVSSKLPAQVIGAILGVPKEDTHKIVTWANNLIAMTDMSEAGFATYTETFGQVTEYARYLWQLKLKHPGDDMVSMLLDAKYEGLPMTVEEYQTFFLMTITAGFETTHSALGQSMLMLVEDPDSYADLNGGDARLMGTAIDELLRLATPAMHMMRAAKEDLMIHDTAIAAGDRVTLWFTAANRDPAMFENPHKLDIRRNASAQAAFGTGGPHFCIGNRLARLEMSIMFEELARTGKRFALDGDVVRTPSIFVNGLQMLPLRVDN